METADLADAAGGQILGDRAEQQDYFGRGRAILSDGRDAPLFLLADGMGGHSGGSVAARLAVDFFLDFAESRDAESFPELLQSGLQVANRAIGERARNEPQLAGMGCTLIAAILEGEQLHYTSVGDSPLFRLKPSGLERINADHSMAPLIEEALAKGDIPANIDRSVLEDQRSALRSAVAGSPISLIDSQTVDMRPGEWLILASDGLLTLDAPAIAQSLLETAERSAQSCVEALLDAVSRAKRTGQDNCTVLAIKVPSFASTGRDRAWPAWLMLGLGVAILAMAGLLVWSSSRDVRTTAPLVAQGDSAETSGRTSAAPAPRVYPIPDGGTFNRVAARPAPPNPGETKAAPPSARPPGASASAPSAQASASGSKSANPAAKPPDGAASNRAPKGVSPAETSPPPIPVIMGDVGFPVLNMGGDPVASDPATSTERK